MAFATVPTVTDAQHVVPQSIVFDSYMTPLAGAQGLLAIQDAMASAEDRWLPRKVGEERSRPALALGILYRTAKFMGLDVPQDHLLMVVAHEVFGHGARFRELGRGRIRYGFDAPIPYGDGGAFTSFRGDFPVSPLALLHVSASGIEAQHTLADRLLENAVSRGRIHYREAWLYFESRVTGMTYILTASPHSKAGHDVADFLEQFQKACTTPCAPLTRRHVQRHALFAAADPLLYYSIYGIAASYIGAGITTGPIPLVPIGHGFRILPLLGYALVPYGAEWTARLALRKEQRAESKEQRAESEEQRDRRGALLGIGDLRVTGVTVRIGETGASTTWGVGVRAADVIRLRGIQVDASVDLWRQPLPLADQTSDRQHLGGGATATIVVPLPRVLQTRWIRGIHVTGGYKSEGYIPGEQLSGGGILRAGIQMQ